MSESKEARAGQRNFPRGHFVWKITPRRLFVNLLKHLENFGGGGYGHTQSPQFHPLLRGSEFLTIIWIPNYRTCYVVRWCWGGLLPVTPHTQPYFHNMPTKTPTAFYHHLCRLPYESIRVLVNLNAGFLLGLGWPGEWAPQHHMCHLMPKHRKCILADRCFRLNECRLYLESSFFDWSCGRLEGEILEWVSGDCLLAHQPIARMHGTIIDSFL